MAGVVEYAHGALPQFVPEARDNISEVVAVEIEKRPATDELETEFLERCCNQTRVVRGVCKLRHVAIGSVADDKRNAPALDRQGHGLQRHGWRHYGLGLLGARRSWL